MGAVPQRRINMLYKKVKKIEEEISVIGIGCWNFGGDWDESNDKNTEDIILTALDNGINFFDIAPVYGFSHSETVLGNIMKKHGFRNHILIASKCGLRWDESRKTRNDLSRKSILWEIDQSLSRLQTDHIDIYQLHWPDHTTPIEETAETLKELKKAGKIRYVGLSNFSQGDVRKYEKYIEVNSQQSLYNMLERNTLSYHNIPLEYKTEEEVLPYVKEQGQAFLPYSPLFQGLLSGTWKDKNNFSKNDIRNENPKFSEPAFSKYFNKTQELNEYANKIGHPLYEIAMNWLRQKEEVTTIIAGANNSEQMIQNLHCLNWDLTTQMMLDLETIIEPLKYL